MPLTIGSNTPSLKVQRVLSTLGSAVSNAFERLSSGQRINRASNDAAGLSVVDTLRAARRIYTQGSRNLNDGISALQIADSALEQLSSVVTRIRELAEQAANGSFSVSQRQAIDMEAQELNKEYFRVSRAASFNGTVLFDGSLDQGLRLQGGVGLDGSIHGSLGGSMGTGSFRPATSFHATEQAYSVTVGDVNGDGFTDVITSSYYQTASILLGNGDGSFRSGGDVAIPDGTASMILDDLNRDGVLDVVTGSASSNKVSVLLGNGDGTFHSAVSFASGTSLNSVASGDLNGDGISDIVVAGYTGTNGTVLLGNGDGSFSGPKIIAFDLETVALGVLNGDGVLDIVAGAYYTNGAKVLLGRGDGTFGPATVFSTSVYLSSIALGDLNGDSVLDIAAGVTGGVMVLLGDGDGSFGPATQSMVGSRVSIELSDLNGDGALDILGEYGWSGLGDGRGAFRAAATFTSLGSIATADFNGDGVLDVASGSGEDENEVWVSLGNQREGLAPLLPFSLRTQADALQALAPLDRKLTQLATQRGVIGAFQSRLSVALSMLHSSAENYAIAESQIRDADVAVEAAELARLAITQQAASAVLAQANQQPRIAVSLLQQS